jgi:hypothetical protein
MILAAEWFFFLMNVCEMMTPHSYQPGTVITQIALRVLK